MKAKIESIIKNYVNNYHNIQDIETRWKEPIVSFANANDPIFYKLKEVVSPTHSLPKDFMEEAETVIAYFIPFENNVTKSNSEGKMSSKIWATAYVETNKLILDLNRHLKNKLEEMSYQSEIIPATHNFDTEKLISDWSHRHVAYITGLGGFGLNNMLITDKGCCGRIGTVITNLKIEPTERKDKEYCLYKYNGSCKKCVDRCVNNALTVDGFNRKRCYDMCLANAEIYEDIGLADVCGKCLANIPCSFIDPIK
ncbi:hypothetical protein KQI42_07405 [Tissierella sp. MSJ-40]|uniref:(Fe-S)-binding protein n=1 Tax=Tissierella simiarum TaxID=2841534 RepID=A0ABS6E6H8_9FIRM|nr:hypothetical protein [Tissierella simiarum]MBU5437829.1 hypothetical protein [Tissierella simiarum]